MADEIRLVTFEGQNVAPINDALMWETAIGDSGVIYGCETTLKDASTLHIETGYGVVCGRHFQIFESDIPVTLSPGGDLLGRLYVHMDLSDASEPIQLLVETAASLTPVEQDDNVNITNGVWEFNLATFDLNALTISNLVNVFPTVAGGGSNLIAGTETGPNASEAYVAGQYIIWASRLWEVIDAIAVGDQFVIGSNLSATNTTVGSELTKINDSINKKTEMKLLWENPNPTTAMADGAEINLSESSSNYDLLKFMYFRCRGENDIMSQDAISGYGTVLIDPEPSSYGASCRSRGLAYTNSTRFRSGGGYISYGSSAVTSNNDVCIPFKIYGIKL